MLVAAALPLVLFALGARRTRYLLPAFPMIALLAARGLEALPGRARRFAVLAAVGFSLVTVFAVYLPFLTWVNTANLQAAGRFLDERKVATVEVTVLPAPGVAINPEVAVPLLDYHTAARIIVRVPAAAAAAAGGAARLVVPVHLGAAAPVVVSRRCAGACRCGTGPDHRRPRRRRSRAALALQVAGRAPDARLRPRRDLPLPDARQRLARAFPK